MAVAAREANLTGLLVPVENAPEAAVVDGVAVYGVESLQHAVALLNGEQMPARRAWTWRRPSPCPRLRRGLQRREGSGARKRALEIAAAGGHNILLIGPPGSGKTMLARRLPTILPTLSLEEAISTTKIHSICGSCRPARRSWRPGLPGAAPHDLGRRLIGAGTSRGPAR